MVKEPGKTGSLWRLPYRVCLPSLFGDFFRLTETEGKGTGESFKPFPIRAGEDVLGERGYSTAEGIEPVAQGGGEVTVRVNPSSLPLYPLRGGAFDRLGEVTTLQPTGALNAWEGEVYGPSASLEGRLCVMRKSHEPLKMAQETIRKAAARNGRDVKPEPFEYAKFVILLTTFPEEIFPADPVLQWYRTRWPVERVFKRFKSRAPRGCLPHYDDDRSKAWWSGKLLVALLIENRVDHAVSLSPWGYRWEEPSSPQGLA
jgi:hypothetical protein